MNGLRTPLSSSRLARFVVQLAPVVVGGLVSFEPRLALATLAGSLSSTNSQILAFIQGDFANLAIYIGLAAAAFTMIVRRGQGFGWAMIVFAVGIVMKNVGWVMDSITDLAGGLH